jgi:hypothetical protein
MFKYSCIVLALLLACIIATTIATQDNSTSIQWSVTPFTKYSTGITFRADLPKDKISNDKHTLSTTLTGVGLDNQFWLSLFSSSKENNNTKSSSKHGKSLDKGKFKEESIKFPVVEKVDGQRIEIGYTLRPEKDFPAYNITFKPVVDGLQAARDLFVVSNAFAEKLKVEKKQVKDSDGLLEHIEFEIKRAKFAFNSLHIQEILNDDVEFRFYSNTTNNNTCTVTYDNDKVATGQVTLGDQKGDRGIYLTFNSAVPSADKYKIKCGTIVLASKKFANSLVFSSHYVITAENAPATKDQGIVTFSSDEKLMKKLKKWVYIVIGVLVALGVIIIALICCCCCKCCKRKSRSHDRPLLQ